MGGYVTKSRDLGKQVDRSNAILLGSPRNGQFNALTRQVTTTYVDNPGELTPRQALNALLEEGRLSVVRPRDNGHTFSTRKEHSKASFVNLTGISGNWVRGHVYPYATPVPVLPVFDETYYGNVAISNSAPDRPVASIYSLVQSVFETRVLLDDVGSRSTIMVPNLFSSYNAWLKSRKSFVRATAGTYLELTFGWEPFIRDIIKLAEAVIHSVDIIQQMQHDNGRSVRRRFYFPDLDAATQTTRNTNVTFGSGGAVYNSILGNVFSGYSGATRSTKSSQKIWFSGSFTYYLKAGNGLNERLERYRQYAQKILGVELTPDVIWNLAPWTWLVDWNVDVSSALQAASLQTNDGLVINYGYLMRQTSMSVKDRIVATHRASPGISTLHSDQFLFAKERFRSTPFGFGKNPNTFSEEQWAILAALGFTKAPKTLW